MPSALQLSPSRMRCRCVPCCGLLPYIVFSLHIATDPTVSICYIFSQLYHGVPRPCINKCVYADSLTGLHVVHRRHTQISPEQCSTCRKPSLSSATTRRYVLLERIQGRCSMFSINSGRLGSQIQGSILLKKISERNPAPNSVGYEVDHDIP